MTELGLGVNDDLEDEAAGMESSVGPVRVSYGSAVQRDAVEARIATKDVPDLGRGVGEVVYGADDDWESKFPIELKIVALSRQE